jgi:hypothetical protein
MPNSQVLNRITELVSQLALLKDQVIMESSDDVSLGRPQVNAARDPLQQVTRRDAGIT